MNKPDEILALIKQYKKIIIHRHQRPDPDALGSQVGLAEILRASFKDKQIFQVGGSVEGLAFLAEMDEITDEVYYESLVIVTDTANAPRISDTRYQLGEKVIKIDHHPNDDPYGEVNWVNAQASSCSEIIFDFYQLFKNELLMTTEAARLLYAGIVGDTGRFLYPATTAHTLEVASQLMTYAFSAAEINKKLEQISMNVAKLAGYVYQNIEVDKHGAAKVILPHALLSTYGIVDSETAAIVSLPGKVEEVVAWGIFVQQPEGHYRVRLRSKGPVINELAKKHHGGGHPLASGANSKDEKENLEIYRELQDLCKK